MFLGNDAASSANFLNARWVNDVLQPAFDAQWQQAYGTPLNSPFQNRYNLATYFNALGGANFINNYSQPILNSGFSNFNALRAAWGNAQSIAGNGVGVGAFFVNNGAPVPASANLTFLIPWVVQSSAASAVQDVQLQKDVNFYGDHHFTFGFNHSDYSDDYNFQASLVVAALTNPVKLVNLDVINAAGQPVGPPITLNGSELPGFYGNAASGGAESSAFYLEDHWQGFGDRLKVDAGVRVETERMNVVFRNRQCCTSELPVNAIIGSTPASPAYNQIQILGSPEALDKNYSGAGWSIGANYAIKHNLAVYGLVSDSFRLPSFNDAVGFAQAAPITSPVEHILQVEGGVRYESRHIDTSVALYYNKFTPRSLVNIYQDINSPLCNAGGTVTNISACPNVNQAYSYGIQNFGMELEVVIRPPLHFLEGFEIRNDIVVQHPTVQGSGYTTVNTDATPQGVITGYNYVTVSEDGRTPQRLAEVNLNIQPNWNLRPLTQIPLKLYGQYEYHSSRYSTSTDVNVTLYPAYYVLNVGALYDINERLSLQLHVANLTNQLTFTEGDPIDATLKAPDGVGTRGDARPLFGRTERLTLNYRF